MGLYDQYWSGLRWYESPSRLVKSYEVWPGCGFLEKFHHSCVVLIRTIRLMDLVTRLDRLMAICSDCNKTFGPCGQSCGPCEQSDGPDKKIISLSSLKSDQTRQCQTGYLPVGTIISLIDIH